MNRKINNKLKQILFLDIETVSQRATYDELTESQQQLWDKKAKFFRSEDKSSSELYEEKAAIFAEFGRIITIGLGYFHFDKDDEPTFKTKAFYFKDEKKILTEFKTFIKSKFTEKTLVLCAHNGKEFDFPYISRRMIINGIELPQSLDLSGKKPWEVPHQDTMEMWKFGDYKNFTSLDLLANVLDVPSSKTDMDGSMVHGVYYKENNLDKIVKYCLQDVVVCTQVYMKLSGLPYLSEEQIQKN